MGDLTKNLSRSEFECQCGCGFDTVDFDLPIVLQNTVHHFTIKYQEYDVRIKINSGTRCRTHNANVGGSAKSRHMTAQAADFYLYDRITGKHINDDEIADYLEERYPDKYGVGRYTGRTHIDTRSNKARWDNR